MELDFVTAVRRHNLLVLSSRGQDSGGLEGMRECVHAPHLCVCPHALCQRVVNFLCAVGDQVHDYIMKR